MSVLYGMLMGQELGVLRSLAEFKEVCRVIGERLEQKLIAVLAK